MGRKQTPGLFKRGDAWHIDKYICGQRIRESTGTSALEEAEKYLARRIDILRQAQIYGVRPKRSFIQAATKYLLENQHKASITNEANIIQQLIPYIGSLNLEGVHMGSLQTFIELRRNSKVKARTINYGLQVVRQILNLAAGEWLDENGLTWLDNAPKIKLLPEHDKRKAYPLSFEEQDKFFAALPTNLRRMALFAVNTGCRDREICGLRWQWEIETPYGSVFVIPGTNVKNREDRLVILNRIAREVINEVRGQHSEFVFTHRGKPFYRMMTSSWKKKRVNIGLPLVRVHDLKHTFGRRLRAAGVSLEDRQDLLGHKNGRITTHYSAAELNNLIIAANKACDGKSSPVLNFVLNQVRKSEPAPTKSPHEAFEGLRKEV